jgi:hypothetical protein
LTNLSWYASDMLGQIVLTHIAWQAKLVAKVFVRANAHRIVEFAFEFGGARANHAVQLLAKKQKHKRIYFSIMPFRDTKAYFFTLHTSFRAQPFTSASTPFSFKINSRVFFMIFNEIEFFRPVKIKWKPFCLILHVRYLYS